MAGRIAPRGRLLLLAALALPALAAAASSGGGGDRYANGDKYNGDEPFAPGCDLGAQPGYWELPPEGKADAERPRFVAMDERCRLRREFEAAVPRGSPRNSDAAREEDLPPLSRDDALRGWARGRPTRVLWLGDSLDQHTVTCFCRRAGGQVKHDRPTRRASADSDRHGTGLRTCVGSPTLEMAQKFIYGVHRTGPWFKGERGSAEKLSADAADEFRAKFGAPPDAVVLSANLWDLARLSVEHSNERLHPLPQLPADTIRGWVANFTAWGEAVVRAFPDTPLKLYHTTPHSTHDAYTGIIHKGWHSKTAFQANLNHAGRHAARALGFGVIDLALMLEGLPAFSYLEDGTHPTCPFLAEELNIILNLDLQRRTAARGGGGQAARP